MNGPLFQRLGWREWLYLAATLVAGRLWVRFDQELLPQRALMPALFVVLLSLLAGFFALVRPSQPFALARTVAVVLGLAVSALIVMQHVILTFDLSYKHGVILGATLVLPFVVATGNKWVNTRS